MHMRENAPVFSSQPMSDTMRQHTPPPWRLQTKGNIGNAIEAYAGKHLFDGDDGFRTVALYQGCCSSNMYLEQEANAAANGRFIVEAVNNHDRLIERCEAYKGQVKAGSDEIASLKADNEQLRKALREARSYIAGQTLAAGTPAYTDCCRALIAIDATLSPSTPGGDGMSEQFDHDDYDQEDCCPNCGGEGVVYSCHEEWACIDPEGGCDLCEMRCDWCRPRKPAPQSSGVARSTTERGE